MWGPYPALATCPKHQLGQVLVLRLPQAPARRIPDLLLPFTVSHPPASALPLARGPRRGRQTMWGGIPQGTGLYAGKMYMPNMLCPEPEHLLSPSRKTKPEREVTANTHLPAPLCPEPPAPPTAAKRGCGGRGSQNKVRETGLWCQRILGWPRCLCPHPSCTRTRSPQGQQSLPKRSFGVSCAAVALPYQHGHLQYTHRSGNFISYTGMEWFWGWP